MKILYPFLGLVLLVSCTKEEATFSTFVITNLSGTTIKIAPNSILKDTLILKNNETREFDIPFTRGINDGINYGSFIDGTPIVVLFNEMYKMVHYNDNLSHTGKYYSQSSGRSFYNTTSYTKTISERTKYIRDVILTYTFTEQDYLNAK